MSPEPERDVPETPPRASPKRRRGLPLALIVVGSLLAFLAVFALWANRQLLDTDNWTDTSTELLENDDIRGQISIFLVDQLYANTDVQARLEEALPPRAAPLAGPAAGALKDLAVRGTNALLERPRPQELWEEANRRAHERFLDIVEGGGDTVSTEGGDITLDLSGLLGQTADRFGAGEQVAERVPEGSAQLTIAESDDLELAQDAVDLLKAAAIALVVLGLGLLALAVYLARGWRREALRAAGFGLALAGAVALVARSFAGDAVVDALASTESVRPAADATWSIATSLLQEAASATLVYGIVLIFAAWLAGPTKLAMGTRRGLAPYLREPSFAYGAWAVIALILLAWGPTPALRRAIPALILVGLLALGIEMLRRQTAREFPKANREESMARMRERFSGLTSRRGAAAAGADRLDQLERLARLRDSGVLDDAEFEREKAALLSS
jgi:putative oligomerization/nucleic acid binding protein